MRLRWNWRLRKEPGNGRDATGRLVDGDTVRPPGWPGWADALAARPAELGKRFGAAGPERSS